MGGAYYNEIEPFAVEWLRNLIAAGHIAPGEVDTRDIRDVKPDDLRGFTQCHFFAGIGLWSLSLRMAGVSDDTPVWTGSCPCQPFSAAGKGRGSADERHLWPSWFHLIEHCDPAIVFGEQVASKAGRAWFGTVRTDLEAVGYAVGAADIGAAGVGAPHIRQRLWFVGQRVDDAAGPRRSRPGQGAESETRNEARLRGSERGRGSGGLADPSCARQPVCECGKLSTEDWQREGRTAEQCRCSSGGMANGHGDGRAEHVDEPGQSNAAATNDTAIGVRVGSTRSTGAPHDPWAAADWLFCRDGKWRPVEPGTFPLADGYPARVGRLRGYGNAIVPQVAAEFIQASFEVMP
ncbi:MAG: DNA cytosine methyltransferase [Pseudomonadota bacterium]